MSAGEYAGMARWMKSIEEQLDLLRQGNPLNNGTVVDPATGLVVSLQQLAFGMDVAKDAGVVELTTNNATWYGGGPDVLDVDVRSGRLVVIHSASLFAGGDRTLMSYSSQVTPAPGTTGLTTVQPAWAEALRLKDNDTAMGAEIAMSYVRVLTGLVPGRYDVKSVYNLTAPLSETTPVGSAEARSLTVLPF